MVWAYTVRVDTTYTTSDKRRQISLHDLVYEIKQDNTCMPVATNFPMFRQVDKRAKCERQEKGFDSATTG